MKRVEFLLDAQEMLEKITEYTLGNWPSSKNEDGSLPEYVSSLILACNNIPERTRFVHDNIRQTKYGPVCYFKYRRHFVFYRETDTCFQIIQILHEKMDFAAYLS